MKYNTGDRVGRLTILDFERRKNGRVYALCLCDCGNRKWIRNYALGVYTNSCGCLQQEVRSEVHTKHGYKHRTEYNIWCGIKLRTLNPNNPAYKDYGGRGIKVCDRWKDSFENFLADMGERPTKEHSIDRIDNNGDYTPENCRWATRKEQGCNKRTNVLLAYNGEVHPISEWARLLGVTYATIYKRYWRGKSIEEIFNL